MENKEKFYTKENFIAKPALLVGLFGLAGGVAGYFTDSHHFFYSYLISFIFWMLIGVGGLFFTMIHHITGSVWSTVLRRIMETAMYTIPVMALFFIPVVFGIHDLYHWSHEDAVAADELLQLKSPYLNSTFFVIRSVVYIGIWVFLASMLYKLSFKQDNGSPTAIRSAKKISASGIILFALTLTFAAFDWLMSLDPHWYSTIYGLYVFAGSFLSILAFLVLAGQAINKRGLLKGILTTEHFHDLGKFLFGFTIFWAYMAFSQYFLIWYANIPEETIFYAHRWEGSWKYITLILVFGNFLIPFLGLMPRAAKRNMMYMKIMAYWILITHWIDLYWLAFPNLYKHDFHFSWMDILIFLGIGGIFLWTFWSNYLKKALVPVNDPHLGESINLIN